MGLPAISWGGLRGQCFHGYPWSVLFCVEDVSDTFYTTQAECLGIHNPSRMPSNGHGTNFLGLILVAGAGGLWWM